MKENKVRRVFGSKPKERHAAQQPRREPNQMDQIKAPGSKLVKKLVVILKGIGPMEKKHRNPHFGYNYVSEGDVMAALSPRLARHGIFFTTSVESMNVQYGDNSKAGVFVAVTTLHEFIDTATDERLAIKGAGVGWDSGDKGVYKAITGATKYALMKNFMITDEQDAETGDQKPAQPQQQQHRRTREYETETGDGPKAAADLLNLKAFLTENKIPDGFLLSLLQEKKLIDGHTKNVAQLKPGVLQRCLSEKTKTNLLTAWKNHVADEESGSATPPDQVRTKEGDQTTNRPRKPAQDDIAPADVLENEGVDNWRKVKFHFGPKKGTPLGKFTTKDLAYWAANYEVKPYHGKISAKDLLLDAALVLASRELTNE